MKSYFLLLSLAASCFGAIEGTFVNSTDGKLQHLQFENGVGKLSDADYQQNKQSLQRDSAGVLAGIEEMSAKLGMGPAARAADKPVKPVKAAATVCPHCGATFKRGLKFYGECGKAIA